MYGIKDRGGTEESSAMFVIDWKTGFRPNADEDYPAEVEQLRAYGFGLLAANPERRIAKAECWPAYTATGKLGNRVTCKVEDLKDYMDNYSLAVGWAMHPDAPFSKATGDHCAFCRVAAAGQCPVMQAEAEAGAGAAALVVSAPRTQLVSLADADAFLCNLAKLDAILDPLKDRAKEMIRAAGGSESWKVGKDYQRKTVDAKAMIAGEAIPVEIVAKYEKNTPCQGKIERRK
jgi:hypothetical protein